MTKCDSAHVAGNRSRETETGLFPEAGRTWKVSAFTLSCFVFPPTGVFWEPGTMLFLQCRHQS